MRRSTLRFASAPPIVETPPNINTTPLIDVLLVLLVMMILTIPLKQHEVPMDLPGAGPPAAAPVIHRLEIARNGAVSLDGRGVAGATLASALATIAADNAATLTIRTDPEARYEPFAETLAAVKRAGITKLGFVGLANSVE